MPTDHPDLFEHPHHGLDGNAFEIEHPELSSWMEEDQVLVQFELQLQPCVAVALLCLWFRNKQTLGAKQLVELQEAK